MEIKECEQAKSGDCCNCQNMAYKLLEDDYKELKLKYNDLSERFDKFINETLVTEGNLQKQLHDCRGKVIKFDKVKEYIKNECCHKYSINRQLPCDGCEYDAEVCDYSRILKIMGEQ